MLTAQDIIIIGQWLKANFIGDFQIDFVKGFEGMYILISTPDETIIQHAYKVQDILRGVNKND